MRDFPVFQFSQILFSQRGAGLFAARRAVSHVASPHALWMADEKKLFLWFHGENDTTRLTTSMDGIRFLPKKAATCSR